jgi:polyisoprenoid-binding protein YceI
MTNYRIDPEHTRAHFKVRHMMISNVNGDFNGISGCVTFDPSDLATFRLEATIDASTLNTREQKRDEHLKSSDFLDIFRFPTITFRSTSIEAKEAGGYEILGVLTLRGVTFPTILKVDSVTPEIKDPAGLFRRGATAQAHIDRRQFGLTWNTVLESGGFLVGDDVQITIDVELVRDVTNQPHA